MLTARFDLPPGPLPVRMHASDATAAPLIDAPFGADLIRFPPGGRVADHTHAGGHILFVQSGAGWVDYEEVPHRLTPGVCYLIPPGVRHGIRAETELTLIAVGDARRPPGIAERLTLCES